MEVPSVKTTNHGDLPFNSKGKIEIEVIAIDKNIFIFKDLDTGELHKVKTPGNDTFTGVTLNVKDMAILRLVGYGLNDLKKRLEFEAHLRLRTVEQKPYDLSAITVTKDRSCEDDHPVKSYTVENKSWHKWSDEQREGLRKAVERGLNVDQIMERVTQDSNLHFTRASISTQINRLGYGIKKGIPYFKGLKRA